MREEYNFDGAARLHHKAISTGEYKEGFKNWFWTFEGKENAITAQKLREGHICKVTGFGQSMTPILKSGQPVVCIPVTGDTKIKKGDIVMCKVGGHYYLHKVIATKAGDRFIIGNNHGHINGTIGRNNIFGLVVEKL